MNPDLIKFIEICLIDGVISEKEREVIFRKSEELGVPRDECEIILEGMLLQSSSNTNKIQKDINTKIDKKPTSSLEEIEKILICDKEIMDFYINQIKSFEKRFNFLIDNQENDNINFREWISKLDGKIKKGEIKYKDQLPYHTIDYNQKEGYKKFPHLLSFTLKKDLDPEFLKECDNERVWKIIGYIHSSELFQVSSDYLLTNKSLYPIVTKSGGYWKGDYLSIDKKNKILISDLKLDNRDHSLIVSKFERLYLNIPSEFSLIDDFLSFKIKYKWSNLDKLIKDLNDQDLDLITGVSIKLKNLVDDLNTFCDDCVNNEFNNEVDNNLRLYGRPKRGVGIYGLVGKCLMSCNNLINKVKLILTVLLLRNKLIYFSSQNETHKFKETKHQLDSLGVLMNYYESNSIKELQNMSQQITGEIQRLNELIEDMSMEFSEGLNKIDNGIGKLNSQVKVGNIISMINLYQNYKSNKNTKSLK